MLLRFEEHCVYLPMMTLEERDNHQKGMAEVTRNARQVSRTLDALESAERHSTHFYAMAKGPCCAFQCIVLDRE